MQSSGSQAVFPEDTDEGVLSLSNKDGCVPCHREIMSQWTEWTQIQFLLQVFVCLQELLLLASWWINTQMLSEYEFLKIQEHV